MNDDSEKRETEDYGGPADDDMGGQSGGSMQGNKGSGGSDRGGDMGSGGGDGGQFGEFEDTGVGTDLTVEMENTDARSGMSRVAKKARTT